MLRVAIPLLLAAACHAQARPVTTADPDAAARRAMAAALDSAAAQGFAGHVLVVRDGEPFFEASRGVIDRADTVPVDGETIFSIGSVTKRFTRAAIIALEEQGKLSLDDPISRFLPDLPADKRRVTIGQVLDMRAGFHEYHDTPGDTVPGDHQRVTREEALRRIAAQPLRFEPGTRREYSNSGYTLLAAIVEEASGMEFERYLRTTFFEPLGMTSTGFYGDRQWAESRMARGMGPRTHGAVNAPHHWPRVSWVLAGAGGMVSTARDLARFVGAVRGGRVLGPEALARLNPREPAIYAGGNDFGFGAIVLELDRGRDVVVVTTHAGARRTSIGVRLAELLGGPPLPAEVLAMLGRPTVASAAGAPPGAPQPDALPDTPQTRTVRAFVGALRDGTPAAIERAVRELFTPEMQALAPMSAHLAMLGDVSRAMKEASVVRLVPAGADRFELRIGEEGSGMLLSMRVEAATPHRLASVGVEDR